MTDYLPSQTCCTTRWNGLHLLKSESERSEKMDKALFDFIMWFGPVRFLMALSAITGALIATGGLVFAFDNSTGLIDVVVSIVIFIAGLAVGMIMGNRH
jgi:hypothetical protein